MTGRGRRDGLLLAATPAAALLLLLPGGGWLLSALAPLTLWNGFRARIRAGELGAATARGVAWAVLLSAGILTLTLIAPAVAGRTVIHGEAYRAEMFQWIATGVGREGDWRSFLPQHALHLTAFAFLAAISRGYLGLALGAALLAYMNYFVARFALLVDPVGLGIVMTWFPWAVARVLAFVAIGALLADPPSRSWDGPAGRRLLLFALLGLALDLLLKTFLAPAWGLWLRPVLVAAGAR